MSEAGTVRAVPKDRQIVTDRLRLREFTIQDHEALHAIMERPETFEFSDRLPMRPDESWARLLRHIGHWAAFGFGMFAVEELGSGELVGEVGFAHFKRGFGADFDTLPEAAWTIAPAHWGHGFAEEAATAAHKWLDQKRVGSSTVCMIYPGNLRSLRVSVKVGYQPFRQLSHKGNPAILFRRRAGAI